VKKLYFIALLISIFPACYPQKAIIISPDLELIQISDKAYIHISSETIPDYGRVAANGLIFIENNEALLFDTPWTDSLTCKLVSYLEDNMKLKIMGFVPNHWHGDCMGGLEYLKRRGITSYANQVTIDIARDNGLPVPEIGFTDSLELKLGEKSVFCFFPGAAHSMDNIVVWIPSERLLFPGCICKSLDARNLGNTADGDLRSYPGTVDRIIKKFGEAVIIIPGHGLPGGQELLTHTRSLCR
jgi:metallo-beta-lactamase class B